MKNKPIKKLLNPIWLGCALYGVRVEDNQTIKLSKVVSINARFIETLNTKYEYSFNHNGDANRFFRGAIELGLIKCRV